jgi:hypothetical protein
MVLSRNQNLSQDLKPVNRIGLFSMMSRNQNLPSVNNVVVAIVHNPKHRRSNELQAPDATRKTGLPKLRIHHTFFHLFVVFQFYCLLFCSLAGRSLVMQQTSCLEMQLATYYLTLLLSSWRRNLHSVFRRTTIARFFLALSTWNIYIYIYLIMISSNFSERITVSISSVQEFPRHSNSSFEALLTNASGNRVTQNVGNHNPFSLSWVVDSGASCHICNDSSLFVNLKPCNVKISTAKSGESIVATGIGDIRLNTWSEQGQPLSIILRGYLVGEARRNLLSVSCLSKQKFQTVLPCDNTDFAKAFMTVVMATDLN